MTVRVRLFAVLRERAGTDHVDLELPGGSASGRRADALADIAGGLTCVMAVNREYADRDRVLSRGDELALIPPVSGGAEPHVAVRSGPLSIDALATLVRDRRAGAVVTFSGVTREVERLEYEAYAEMAESAMREIVSAAIERHGLCAAAAEHRVGSVPLSEPSVIVATSAPHRGPAVRGCARDHRRDQGARADLEARGRGRRAPLGRGQRARGGRAADARRWCERGHGAGGRRMTTHVRELAAGETQLAWEAMRELRPHIGNADEFAARIDELQRPNGYRLLASFEHGRDSAAAVAGFRVLETLFAGRMLYVDDLSTLPAARGRGHAKALLERLDEEGQRSAATGCSSTQASGRSAGTRTASTCVTACRSSRTTSRRGSEPSRGARPRSASPRRRPSPVPSGRRSRRRCARVRASPRPRAGSAALARRP